MDTPLPLREQALDIVRNLVADAAPAEVGKVADNIGYDTLLHSLQLAVKCRVSGLQAPVSEHNYVECQLICAGLVGVEQLGSWA